MTAFAGGRNVHNINYVQLVDLAARKKLKERQAKAARASFISKPWTM